MQKKNLGSPEILCVLQVLSSFVRAPVCSAVLWLAFSPAACSDHLAHCVCFFSKGIYLYIILHLLYGIVFFSYFASCSPILMCV